MLRSPRLAALWPAAALALATALAGCVSTGPPAAEAAPCGPQAPRDLAVAGGTNERPVPGAAAGAGRLCNVHFHRPAEHVGIAPCPAVEAAPGPGACGAHGAAPVRAGDEIEVHWVYTSCPPAAERRTGLAACTCGGADDTVLRVVGRQYVLAAEGDAAETALREPAGGLARYGGSTTGPDYSGGSAGDPRPCSPVPAWWEVAAGECRPLALSALAAWCADNEWGEDHAHGAREAITRADWLAPYRPPER